MVVDRLSDTCIEATKTAMSLGHKMGVSEVRNELLFAGIVAHPERARRTLDEFGIVELEVGLAARQVLRDRRPDTGRNSGRKWFWECRAYPACASLAGASLRQDG